MEGDDDVGALQRRTARRPVPRDLGRTRYRATIIWPPNADLAKHDDAIPGSDDVVEYLYRGNGAADYVGGLLDPSVDTPPER